MLVELIPKFLSYGRWGDEEGKGRLRMLSGSNHQSAATVRVSDVGEPESMGKGKAVEFSPLSGNDQGQYGFAMLGFLITDS